MLAYGKGAEYALNLAVRYDAIDHLVLLAPAAYSFCGLRLNDHSSSWTKKRKDVPCIDQKRSYGFADVLWPMLTRGIVYFRGAYEAAIARDAGREDKRIKVEETDAEILMLAGLDDCVWDSPGMAELVRSHVRHATICSFTDAGHLFEGDGFLKVADLRIKNDGTTEGNERASRESADAIEDFLYAHHPELGEA